MECMAVNNSPATITIRAPRYSSADFMAAASAHQPRAAADGVAEIGDGGDHRLVMEVRISLGQCWLPSPVHAGPRKCRARGVGGCEGELVGPPRGLYHFAGAAGILLQQLA